MFQGLPVHCIGYFSFRYYCPNKGRRVPNERKYYPAHLKLNNYVLKGSNHDDYNFDVLSARPPNEYNENIERIVTSVTTAQYQVLQRETGIVKPSLLSGLPARQMLPIPGCFAGDLMHLFALNVTQLLIHLWRGSIKCKAPDNKATWAWAVLQGDVWERHGRTVAAMTPYLPGSFDVPP